MLYGAKAKILTMTNPDDMRFLVFIFAPRKQCAHQAQITISGNIYCMYHGQQFNALWFICAMHFDGSVQDCIANALEIM